MVLVKDCITVASVMIVAYLLGSVSFSIIVTKWISKHADIRSMGSGNAGFTNVLRSVGKLAGILTFIGDFLKGILAVWIAKMLFSSPYFLGIESFVVLQIGAYLAGICCLIGHIYPCFFGFKGGKGVLTASAIVLMIDWRVFLLVIAVFLIVFLVSKIVSLASISAAAAYPIATFCITFFLDYLSHQGEAGGLPIGFVLFSTGISLLIGSMIIFMHRSNIKRLRAGTEKRLVLKR